MQINIRIASMSSCLGCAKVPISSLVDYTRCFFGSDIFLKLYILAHVLAYLRSRRKRRLNVLPVYVLCITGLLFTRQ